MEESDLSADHALDTAAEWRLLLLVFPEIGEIRAPLGLVLRAIGELHSANATRLGGWLHTQGDLDRGMTYQLSWPLC